MTGQFQGETVWEAIVNENGLDLEEEASFRDWLRAQGFPIGEEYHINPNISLEQLENALAMWQSEGDALAVCQCAHSKPLHLVAGQCVAVGCGCKRFTFEGTR